MTVYEMIENELEEIGDESTVGARLVRAINRKQISMRELSRKTGYCQPSISKWCSGKSEPKLEYIRKMADALGVSPEWIAFGYQTQGDHGRIGRSGNIRAETDFSLAFSEQTSRNLFGSDRDDLTLFHLTKSEECSDNVVTEAFVVDMGRKSVNEAGFWLIRGKEGVICRYVVPQGYTFVISEGMCSASKKVACEVTKLDVVGRVKARFILERL